MVVRNTLSFIVLKMNSILKSSKYKNALLAIPEEWIELVIHILLKIMRLKRGWEEEGDRCMNV